MKNEDCFTTLVDCGATTHIVTKREKFIQLDPSFDADKHIVELADGSRSSGAVKGRGKAQIEVTDKEGNIRSVVLDNALYIPSYTKDIFSVQAAIAKGAHVNFSPECSELITKSGTVFPIRKSGRLYYLYALKSGTCGKLASEWHKIVGHCNIDDLVKLPGVTNNMKIKGELKFDCDTCTLGKMSKSFNRKPDVKATQPLQLVHSDLAGPIGPMSSGKHKYVINFVDDFSGCSFVYFLQEKSDTFKAIQMFLCDVSPYGNVKCLRTDNGGEFESSNVKELLLTNQIKHERSAPHSPHQNGTSERYWRTLFDTARCFLLESGVAKCYWQYAVLAANYCRNRCLNKRLNLTPMEAFCGKRPDMAKLHLFGSVCYAYVENKKKLDPRCQQGLFFGYDKQSPAYFVFFPKERIVRKVRCVKFTDK